MQQPCLVRNLLLKRFWGIDFQCCTMKCVSKFQHKDDSIDSDDGSELGVLDELSPSPVIYDFSNSSTFEIRTLPSSRRLSFFSEQTQDKPYARRAYEDRTGRPTRMRCPPSAGRGLHPPSASDTPFEGVPPHSCSRASSIEAHDWISRIGITSNPTNWSEDKDSPVHTESF